MLRTWGRRFDSFRGYQHGAVSLVVKPRVVIPLSPVRSWYRTPNILIEACQKLIDDGPNCQGRYLHPQPLTGREPCGLLVTVEVM